MQKKNILFTAQEGEVLVVKNINASERKRNFYNRSVFSAHEKNNPAARENTERRIKSGKTKLALAGKATDEIICERK